MTASTADLLANAVLVLHAGVALFIVAGLGLVVIGNVARWPCVNGVGFRLAHLVAIGIVVAESWFGVPCPLTLLEMSLRSQAGTDAYGGGFIAHWVGRLLYYDVPSWVFALAYSLFGMMVVVAWWCFPVKRRERFTDGRLRTDSQERQ